MSFHGTFDHTLDAKNRLTVPSKFRAALAGKVFLSPQARELSRLFYANAMEIELDGAGRIMLPARFMEAAGIGSREVVVAGAGPCLELWDRDIWADYDADLALRAPDLTSALVHPA